MNTEGISFLNPITDISKTIEEKLSDIEVIFGASEKARKASLMESISNNDKLSRQFKESIKYDLKNTKNLSESKIKEVSKLVARESNLFDNFEEFSTQFMHSIQSLQDENKSALISKLHNIRNDANSSGSYDFTEMSKLVKEVEVLDKTFNPTNLSKIISNVEDSHFSAVINDFKEELAKSVGMYNLKVGSDELSTLKDIISNIKDVTIEELRSHKEGSTDELFSEAIDKLIDFKDTIDFNTGLSNKIFNNFKSIIDTSDMSSEEITTINTKIEDIQAKVSNGLLTSDEAGSTLEDILTSINQMNSNTSEYVKLTKSQLKIMTNKEQLTSSDLQAKNTAKNENSEYDNILSKLAEVSKDESKLNISTDYHAMGKELGEKAKNKVLGLFDQSNGLDLDFKKDSFDSRGSNKYRGKPGLKGKMGRAFSTIKDFGSNHATGLKALGVGAVVGTGLSAVSDYVGKDTGVGALTDVGAQTASMAGTGAMIGSVIPVIGTTAGAIIGGAIGLASGVMDNQDQLSKSIDSMMDSVEDSISSVVDNTEDIVKRSAKTLTDFIPGLGLLKKGFDIVSGPEGFSGLFTSITDTTADAIKKTKDSIGKISTESISAITDTIRSVSTNMKGFFSHPIDTIKSGVSRGTTAVKDYTSKTIGNVQAMLGVGNASKNKEALVKELKNSNMSEKEINAVLGNVAGESGFQLKSENLDYSNTSNSRIREIFGSRASGKTDAELDKIKSSPESMGEFMYGSSTSIGNSMGNTNKGDGYTYRGRGYVQLTGKNNYKAAGDAIGVDLVSNPDLVNDPEIGAKVTAWFIKKNGKSMMNKMGINENSSQADVSRAINSAVSGRVIKEGEASYLGELNDKKTKYSMQFANSESNTAVPMSDSTKTNISNIPTTEKPIKEKAVAQTIPISTNNTTINNYTTSNDRYEIDKKTLAGV